MNAHPYCKIVFPFNAVLYSQANYCPNHSYHFDVIKAILSLRIFHRFSGYKVFFIAANQTLSSEQYTVLNVICPFSSSFGVWPLAAMFD